MPRGPPAFRSETGSWGIPCWRGRQGFATLEGMAVRNARSQRTARGQTSGRGRLLRVGDMLAGKYRVERILGEGGMGVVVAAHHELLDQRVAVKLLYQDSADREAQSRLLLEARAAAKIQSDHVARVVDVDTGEDGLPFIVMELLEGADLCAVADARGPLPRWLVVDYVLQTLEGLAHAHARGIVHRDLKPSNLFLASRADGMQIIKILDFGISKTPEPESSKPSRGRELTGGGSVLGSPPYMSPEQVRAPRSVDHRTDIWALGVLMYELLTNTMPFGGEEMQEVFAHILEHQPIPIRSVVHGVPEGLEQVIFRCLSKKRELRFDDVGELARALAPYGSGTWAQSADRVAATLARGAPEEPNSGLRLRGAGDAVPSSPKRRDSQHPDFHGTASTVSGASRGGSRKWIMLAIVVPAALGVGIGTAAFFRARRLMQENADPAASTSGGAVVDLAPAADPRSGGAAGAATGIVTGPVHVAGPESEAPPTSPVQGGVALPAPRVVAASPAPESVSSSKRGTGRPAAPASSARKVTVPSAPTTSPATTGRPALPAGLPLTRE